jgi:Rha family phage regulatory protein
VLARTFRKRHTNVLRAYDNLKCSDEFRRLNFEASEYINEQGKTQRSVTMTKDGFVMLVMGFTGPSAMVFKEAYIATFNAMARPPPATTSMPRLLA